MLEINNEEMHPKLMWKPGLFGKTKMDCFRELINERFRLNLVTYWELYKWSIDNYSDFWEQFWSFANIIYTNPYDKVIDENIRIDEIPEWFTGAKLNYTQNILENSQNRFHNKIALYIAEESKSVVEKVTFGQMRARIQSLVAAMRKIGITNGDRVVGYLPNGRLAVEAYLATSIIGAIWSSTSPDFGISGVLERLRQIKPKLIYSVDAVFYKGKRHNHFDKLSQLIHSLDCLKKVVISPLEDSNEEEFNEKLKLIPNSLSLKQFIAQSSDQNSINYFEAPFNYPLCILFSSGTTGEPKCLVHSVGGTLIQHLKEHILHGNMDSKDILMFYTTTGWMMWNWLVSALATGAAIVLYEGSPFMPSPSRLWDIIDEIGVTILGTSPKYLQTSEEMGLNPKSTHNLQTLHTILSTGSPLTPKNYEYVYNKIKTNVLLGSISGGSDIISCFMGQNPTIPVYSGEIQSINLGMAVECWNDRGIAVKGMKGELVCTKPFPSMPTMFWNDPKGNKYKSAYFSHYEGVWTHGDYCLINDNTNGILMLGRSDGTLNPNGVRFGSSEIYNIIETYDEVEDCVCVSQISPKNEERVVLFLKMKKGFQFCNQLIDSIKCEIKQKLSPRHIPSVILQVSDIPYTINGKKIEVAVKLIISGKEVSNKNAIANPESLELFKNRIELQNY